ncbi:hypothetical protein BKI52_03790 [marine bacterium AO1-C]|nr:hypothetical protein BKI52_03790 [marine bacterium AO1-C]
MLYFLFLAQLQQLTRTGIVFRIANFQNNICANITESLIFADDGNYFNKQVTKEIFFTEILLFLPPAK